MDDPVVAAAVVDAIRLTARNERFQAAQRAQLAELGAAEADSSPQLTASGP